jgi:hypothetical protein
LSDPVVVLAAAEEEVVVGGLSTCREQKYLLVRCRRLG